MLHLICPSFKLIDKQSAIEQQLNPVLLLYLWHVRIIAWTIEWHKTCLSRLLLYDDTLPLILIEKVETTLYSQHYTEE